MALFGIGRRDGSDARVAAVRSARRRQGHALTALQEGIVRAVARWDPSTDAASAQAFAAVAAAVEAEGAWRAEEEWRIGTWFANAIVAEEAGGRRVFAVSVSCDGQTLACRCPTVERAYGFVRLYQGVIVDQFYSVGAPWMEGRLFGAGEG